MIGCSPPLVMSHTDRIQQLLLEKPGLKAQQIAGELGLDRSEVAAALHRLAGGDFTQDSTYRWWPRAAAAVDPTPASRSLIGRLCRYYLQCLARESGPAVSLPAAGADAGYVVLDHLPFVHAQPALVDRAVKKLLRKVRQERGQLSLYIGYAIRLRPAPMRPDEMRIEPALIYPIDETAESPA
jgi:hypothetical protein